VDRYVLLNLLDIRVKLRDVALSVVKTFAKTLYIGLYAECAQKSGFGGMNGGGAVDP